MSKKPPSLVQFNFKDESVSNNLVITEQEISQPLTTTEDLQLVLSEEDSQSEDDGCILQIEEKEKIIHQELFDDFPDNLAVLPDELKDKIKPVKVKKPRKPMSVEHKAKLAIAREKAMISRKAKAIERKQMKDLDIEEKELVKVQRIKRVQKLKKEVNSDTEDDISVKTTKTTNITKKDLEEAQLDAIMKYEALRKKRKEEKRQAKIIEDGKLKMLNQIQQATGGTQYRYKDGSNRYDNCY